RNVKGGEERLLRRRRMNGVPVEQDFAADALQLRVEPVLAGSLRRRECGIQGRRRSIEIAVLGFSIGQDAFEERVKGDGVLLAKLSYAAPHFRQAGRVLPGPPSRPPLRELAVGLPKPQIVLTREMSQRGGEGRGARELSPHHLEQDRVDVSVGDRPDMRDLRDSRLHLIYQIERPINFAEWPQRKGEIAHGGDAEVLPETKGEIAVAVRIECGE